MAVKCTECGASIQDDSRFCKYCGAKVPEEAKIDIKKREYRIETINHAKIRREELRAQQHEKELEAQNEHLEKLKELRAEENKGDKRLYIFVGVAFAFLFLMYLIIGK